MFEPSRDQVREFFFETSVVVDNESDKILADAA